MEATSLIGQLADFSHSTTLAGAEFLEQSKKQSVALGDIISIAMGSKKVSPALFKKILEVSSQLQAKIKTLCDVLDKLKTINDQIAEIDGGKWPKSLPDYNQPRITPGMAMTEGIPVLAFAFPDGASWLD